MAKPILDIPYADGINTPFSDQQINPEILVHVNNGNHYAKGHDNVSNVPLPATVWLFGIGVLWILSCCKRHNII